MTMAATTMTADLGPTGSLSRARVVFRRSGGSEQPGPFRRRRSRRIHQVSRHQKERLSTTSLVEDNDPLEREEAAADRAAGEAAGLW